MSEVCGASEPQQVGGGDASVSAARCHLRASPSSLAVNMKRLEPHYSVNGEQPQIVGEVCEGFYLLQQQQGRHINDPANVAFLKFRERWYRIYFDGGTIFWRESELPGEPVNSGIDSALVLVNLCEMVGVVGARLESIAYGGAEEAVVAEMKFSSGRSLTFRHLVMSDETTLDC